MYSAEDIHPHTNLLWYSLRREVMEGANKDVEEAALSALTAVVRVLEVGLTTAATRAAAATLIEAAVAGIFSCSYSPLLLCCHCCNTIVSHSFHVVSFIFT